MRSLAQKGNQAKFLHRMPGIQRSPAVYNLQHLREYNSCRIWASQSRRPPYVADVEGCSRIEGVVALIHERNMDGQQGGGRRRLQNPLRCDHLRQGPPILGGPVEAQEQASENDGISRQSKRPSRDAGGDTSTNKICCGAPRVNAHDMGSGLKIKFGTWFAGLTFSPSGCFLGFFFAPPSPRVDFIPTSGYYCVSYT